MPIKSGKLTPQEIQVASIMAATGSQAHARAETRMSQSSVSRIIARPAVQAEIARIQVEKLFTEALPAAVDCLVSIIRSDKAPAGARVQAAKVVMDRTLGADDVARTKEASEMSGEELARAIAALEREASERARVVNPEPVNPPDIFE